MSVRVVPWNQSINALYNVCQTLETSSPFNASCLTTSATVLANAQLSISPNISLAPKPFFTNAGPISDLNDRLLSRKPLKNVFFNI